MHIYTSSSSDDSEVENDNKLIVEPKATAIQLHSKTRLQWSNKDLLELAKQIRQVLPKHDTLSYYSRHKKINWDEIKFNNYSGKDCKNVWMQLQNGIRKVSNVKEVVSKIKENISSIPKPQKCRHSAKPKKYRNAYLIFCQEYREKNLKENQGIKQKISSRKLSEMFSQLSDAERGVYNAQENENKKVWMEKTKQFYSKYPLESKKTKPSSPFELYYESQLKTKDTETKQISKKEYRDIWKTLEDTKKFEFINLAKHNEDIFLRGLSNVDEKKKYKSVITQADHQLIDKIYGKPKRPPRSGYWLFTQEVLKKLKNKRMLKVGVNQWTNLRSEEKAVYNARSKQMHKEYDKQYKAYLLKLPEHKRAEEVMTIKSKKRRQQYENLDKSHKIKKKRKEESKTIENTTKTPPVNESESIFSRTESNLENNDTTTSDDSSSYYSSSDDDSSSTSAS